MNEAIIITGAVFAVLTALIFNRRDVTELKAEMKENNALLRTSISELRSEMREGFSNVNTRFERLEVRMDKMQSDLNTFAVVSALHDQRITALEAAKH